MALSLPLALLLLASPFTWDGSAITEAAAGRSGDRHAYGSTAASSWRRRISQASSDSAVVAGSGGCSLIINGAEKQFAACTNVSGMVTPYTLAWTLQEPPAGGDAGATLSIGLSAQIGTLAPGWIALGFPAQPASMLGSTAFILKGCSSCASGASIAEHSLPDRTTNHPPSAAISASSLQAVASPDGTQLQATFDVQLTGSVGSTGSGAGADPQVRPGEHAGAGAPPAGTPAVWAMGGG